MLRLCEQYEARGAALASRLLEAAAKDTPPVRDPASSQLVRAKQLLQEALHLDENGEKVELLVHYPIKFLIVPCSETGTG
jgi:hypothetical protein